MNEILTADDFYNDDLTPLENMINFAKIHLQKAQKVWFGKINDKVIEFRKYYNQVNSNYNDINEVLANNKELSDKIDSAFLKMNNNENNTV